MGFEIIQWLEAYEANRPGVNGSTHPFFFSQQYDQSPIGFGASWSSIYSEMNIPSPVLWKRKQDQIRLQQLQLKAGRIERNSGFSIHVLLPEGKQPLFHYSIPLISELDPIFYAYFLPPFLEARSHGTIMDQAIQAGGGRAQNWTKPIPHLPTLPKPPESSKTMPKPLRGAGPQGF